MFIDRVPPFNSDSDSTTKKKPWVTPYVIKSTIPYPTQKTYPGHGDAHVASGSLASKFDGS